MRSNDKKITRDIITRMWDIITRNVAQKEKIVPWQWLGIEPRGVTTRKVLTTMLLRSWVKTRMSWQQIKQCAKKKVHVLSCGGRKLILCVHSFLDCFVHYWDVVFSIYTVCTTLIEMEKTDQSDALSFLVCRLFFLLFLHSFLLKFCDYVWLVCLHPSSFHWSCRQCIGSWWMEISLLNSAKVTPSWWCVQRRERRDLSEMVYALREKGNMTVSRFSMYLLDVSLFRW